MPQALTPIFSKRPEDSPNIFADSNILSNDKQESESLNDLKGPESRIAFLNETSLGEISQTAINIPEVFRVFDIIFRTSVGIEKFLEVSTLKLDVFAVVFGNVTPSKKAHEGLVL
jgi:hypothetical protein